MPLAGLTLALMLMVMPSYVSAETTAEQLQTASDEVRAQIQDTRAELQALQTTCDASVNDCLTAMVDELEGVDALLVQAEKDLWYNIIFANAQEKRTLQTTLRATISYERVKIEELESIQADLTAGTITEDEAKTEINTLVDEARADLNSRKDAFKNKLEEFLKLKVHATDVYLGWQINDAKAARDNYKALDFKTARLNTLLTQAEDLHTEGDTLYTAGIDGQGDDITELHQAATKLLQSRRAMNKVAVRLAAMEAKWSTDRAE